MIDALTPDDYKNIFKVSILDSKKVFYPLKYVLEKRDITYDDDFALIICPKTDDIKFPSSGKLTDSGILRDYKVELSINNQSDYTQEQLEEFENKKVIVVFHHPNGKIIIGCNEMPLLFQYDDDNTVSPSGDHGFSISCRGNAYFLKVSL